LYAHLQNLPDLKVGDPVGCGQVIGAVGTPEIHTTNITFEVRVGPSSARFGSMAHYDNSADMKRWAVIVHGASAHIPGADPMTIFD
jgi:murein DD-endopeptidase MepM/ murein hydrolase activator NlpD